MDDSQKLDLQVTTSQVPSERDILAYEGTSGNQMPETISSRGKRQNEMSIPPKSTEEGLDEPSQKGIDDSKSNMEQVEADVALLDNNYSFENGTYVYSTPDGQKYSWYQSSNSWEQVCESSKSTEKAIDSSICSTEPPKKRHKSTNESENEEEEEKTQNSNVSNYTVENGTYVYTNDAGEKLAWNQSANVWEARQEVPPNYVFDGNTYFHKDSEGKYLSFNKVENKWDETSSEIYAAAVETQKNIPQPTPTVDAQVLSGEMGSYEWDSEKGAWFPKIDEDFMARYQMSYGVTDESQSVVENQLKSEDEAVGPEQKLTQEKKAPKPPSWFEIEDALNTKVYVSSLPLDMSEKEFVEFMTKCGLVAKELKTNKWKIKMYKDKEGNFKGDALCDYIKVESVLLALQFLDSSEIRGHKVRVERAKFQLKGEYDPALKPKKMKKKDLEKLKKKQEKLLEWKPEALRGERQKHESVVVIKRLFNPEDIDKNPPLLLELQNLLRKECAKFGEVRKVIVHDLHPEGVAQVFFKDAESADDCVVYMHGRWLNNSKVSVETWDGKTKYKIQESEEDRKVRLERWGKFLEEKAEDRIDE